MGMMNSAAAWLRCARYVWWWRARYWYLDTPAGRFAQFAALLVAALVVVAQLARMLLAVHRPADEPVQAVYWWVVQLVIMVVAAAWAYMNRPKPQSPPEQEIESPLVADGAAAKDYFGTVWIDYSDKALLAWKLVGRDPIYSKGGKK